MMTNNVDDIHNFDRGFIRAMERLDELDTSEENKKLVKGFIMHCRRQGLAKSTITHYTNILKRMIERFEELNFTKTIDQIEQDDFDELLLHLEEYRKISVNEIRNYKKVTKKFYGWLTEDRPPKWIKALKLGTIETPVQPSDLLTQDEFDRLLAACRHPRDKAFIAVLADSGMRVGALASCRVKNVEFHQHGAIIYISTTSKSRKTTAPKGIPITWSTGFLSQWLSVHSLRDEEDAPLWLTIDGNCEPLTYKSARKILYKVARRAGIKKRVNPHSLRHKAITTWILDGLNEQEIKHRAGWSKGSMQMMNIYANFTDQEINDKIFEKYGLRKKEKRPVTLKWCPRCNNVLRPKDRFCSQCSLVLDREMAKEVEQKTILMPDTLNLLLADPKMQALMADKLRELMGLN